MPIVFDPVNKIINITSPTVNLTAQDLYNSSMDWADELSNLMYDVPMDANGKFLLATGVYSDIVYRLLKDWKLKWFPGDKIVIVSGTLISDDGTARTIPADSGNVETVFQVATSGTIEQNDVIIYSQVSDTTPAAGEFNGAGNLVNDTNDMYAGSVLVFTSGELKGICRKITSYVASTRTFKFLGATSGRPDAPFPKVPADGDRFRILGRMA